MNKIIFCDKTDKFANAINKEFTNIVNNEKYNFLTIDTHTANIEDLRGNNYAYFSPANSFLFFDGGIDAVYSKMFLYLQRNAQNLIKKYNIKTTLGRCYLPIGSSLLVSVYDRKIKNENYKYQYVVACPTMFRPQDIRGTNNVYYAFLAGLALIYKYNSQQPNKRQIKTLVCPGLGTGYGKIKYEECAKQIRNAFIDYFDNKTNDKLQSDILIYLDEPNKDEQPNFYENMELKNIEIKNIIFK